MQKGLPCVSYVCFSLDIVPRMQEKVKNPHAVSFIRTAAHSEASQDFLVVEFADGRGRDAYLLISTRKEVMQMEIHTKIARVKELIAKRDELDAELSELLSGTARERRSPKCSICGEPGHRASTCPAKPSEAVVQ